jgi:hypothetical protein
MSDDEVAALEIPTIPGRALPSCFHLPGQYANQIINSNGDLVMLSKEVRVIDATTDSAINYVARCSHTEHHCLICDGKYKCTNNSSSNIINNHIKLKHPEFIPFNFMNQKYVDDAIDAWEKAESTKDVKKRKATVAIEEPVIKVQQKLTSMSFLSAESFHS